MSWAASRQPIFNRFVSRYPRLLSFALPALSFSLLGADRPEPLVAPRPDAAGRVHAAPEELASADREREQARAEFVAARNEYAELLASVLTSEELAGRALRHLGEPAERSAGRHELFWDGILDDGSMIRSGVYFYRIEAGSFTATRKMLVVRD